MKLLPMSVIVVALCACATVEKTEELPRLVQSFEFNSTAGRYMPKLTTLAMERKQSGQESLLLTTEIYGMRDRTNTIGFIRGKADEYGAMLDKFVQWSAQAKARGDTLTKEMGRLPVSNAMASESPARFTFHTASGSAHFLAIHFCAAMYCQEHGHFLDVENAIKLRDVLKKFDAGQLRGTDAAAYK